MRGILNGFSSVAELTVSTREEERTNVQVENSIKFNLIPPLENLECAFVEHLPRVERELSRPVLRWV